MLAPAQHKASDSSAKQVWLASGTGGALWGFGGFCWLAEILRAGLGCFNEPQTQEPMAAKAPSETYATTAERQMGVSVSAFRGPHKIMFFLKTTKNKVSPEQKTDPNHSWLGF